MATNPKRDQYAGSVTLTLERVGERWTATAGATLCGASVRPVHVATGTSPEWAAMLATRMAVRDCVSLSDSLDAEPNGGGLVAKVRD